MNKDRRQHYSSKWQFCYLSKYNLEFSVTIDQNYGVSTNLSGNILRMLSLLHYHLQYHYFNYYYYYCYWYFCYHYYNYNYSPRLLLQLPATVLGHLTRLLCIGTHGSSVSSTCKLPQGQSINKQMNKKINESIN